MLHCIFWYFIWHNNHSKGQHFCVWAVYWAQEAHTLYVSYHEYCINAYKEDRRNSESVTLDYKLLIKVFSQEDEVEKEDTLDLVCELPLLWEGTRLCTIDGCIS